MDLKKIKDSFADDFTGSVAPSPEGMKVVEEVKRTLETAGLKDYCTVDRFIESSGIVRLSAANYEFSEEQDAYAEKDNTKKRILQAFQDKYNVKFSSEKVYQVSEGDIWYHFYAYLYPLTKPVEDSKKVKDGSDFLSSKEEILSTLETAGLEQKSYVQDVSPFTGIVTLYVESRVEEVDNAEIELECLEDKVYKLFKDKYAAKFTDEDYFVEDDHAFVYFTVILTPLSKPLGDSTKLKDNLSPLSKAEIISRLEASGLREYCWIQRNTELTGILLLSVESYDVDVEDLDSELERLKKKVYETFKDEYTVKFSGESVNDKDDPYVFFNANLTPLSNTVEDSTELPVTLSVEDLMNLLRKTESSPVATATMELPVGTLLVEYTPIVLLLKKRPMLYSSVDADDYSTKGWGVHLNDKFLGVIPPFDEDDEDSIPLEVESIVDAVNNFLNSTPVSDSSKLEQFIAEILFKGKARCPKTKKLYTLDGTTLTVETKKYKLPKGVQESISRLKEIVKEESKK